MRVCVCVSAPVLGYVRGHSREPTENKRERARRRLCLGAGEREARSVRTRVTYVPVYPCMQCLGKYKMQKGFWCNVHLTVPRLCLQAKQRCPEVLNNGCPHARNSPRFHLSLFCVISQNISDDSLLSPGIWTFLFIFSFCGPCCLFLTKIPPFCQN